MGSIQDQNLTLGLFGSHMETVNSQTDQQQGDQLGGRDSGERGRSPRIGFGAGGMKRKGQIRGAGLDKGQDGRSKGEARVINQRGEEQ